MATVLELNKSALEAVESQERPVILKLHYERDGIIYTASITTNDGLLTAEPHCDRVRRIKEICSAMNAELTDATIISASETSLM